MIRKLPNSLGVEDGRVLLEQGIPPSCPQAGLAIGGDGGTVAAKTPTFRLACAFTADGNHLRVD